MKKFKLIPIQSIKKEPFNGTVYDFEVEHNHSYTVQERIAVHNSACSTRIQTGFGLPLFTSIMLIRRVLHGMKSNVALIADGGIRNSGDIVKALAVGADCVMLGRKLCVSQESSAFKHSKSIPTYRGSMTNVLEYYTEYRGQASQEFMWANDKKATPEGVTTMIKTSEMPSVKSIIDDLVGGVRSGLSYAGANNLTELYDKAVFIEQSYNSYVEGTPHGTNV